MKDEVQEIRRKIILHSLNVLLAAMAPTFMLSVYRSLSIDWQATTTVHGGLLVVCITLVYFFTCHENPLSQFRILLTFSLFETDNAMFCSQQILRA